MRAMIIGGLWCFAFGAVALAHITDEENDQLPYTGYDCSAMSGEFTTGKKLTVSISVYRGKVLVIPKDGEKAVSDSAIGDCIAPKVSNSNFYARALFRFDSKFAAGQFSKELGAADCCIGQFQDDALSFDNSALKWKRKR